MAKNAPPKVRIVKPAGRPIQLRYTDPETRKEVRISTGSHDEQVATDQKKTLEAKLLLGIDTKPRKRAKGSASMPWEDFRERYTEKHLSRLKSGGDADNRLDIATRILKPRTLADVANREALNELQRRLLDGAEGKKIKDGDTLRDRPRSAHTVKTNMAVVFAALRWAECEGWLPTVPKIHGVKTAKLKHMKGRPITLEEFERMLAKTADIVGEAGAPSWRHMLRGLWESGLRLGELLHVHWTDDRYIMPVWRRGALPVLSIPATMQKNATEESIPLLPGFEELLLLTPDHQRSGWAFNPSSLQPKSGRRPRHGRVSKEWAGKILSRIGKKAGVVVEPAKGFKQTKFASAHDLRRSCADGLVAAGVPDRELSATMRHANSETTRRYYAPGNVQRSAGVIRECLASEKAGATA